MDAAALAGTGVGLQFLAQAFDALAAKVRAGTPAASVSRAAEFMCLPRVIDRPMPKNSTPNFAFFMRSIVAGSKPARSACWMKASHSAAGKTCGSRWMPWPKLFGFSMG